MDRGAFARDDDTGPTATCPGRQAPTGLERPGSRVAPAKRTRV